MSEKEKPLHSNKALINRGVEKIHTLIEGFDDITHGGLPKGRSTLVSGTSGTGKTLFSLQFPLA